MIINAVYFSPTGNTKGVVLKLAGMISERLKSDERLIETDFTFPERRKTAYRFAPDELVVFGMPTYAGRIPNKLLPFVQEGFQGDGAAAVAVVTYGNRGYDSSLSELRLELVKDGFDVLGAVAVPCRHAFSQNIGGAPWSGWVSEKTDHFVEVVSGSLIGNGGADKESFARFDETVRPYYIPLREDGQPAKFLKAVPKTNEDLCDRCGICAPFCPMGSIDTSDCRRVTGVCIKCQACVLRCPRQAKYFDDPDFLSHVRMLEKNFSERKEAEYFLF